MTSSTLLNTELTAIRAIIPAERASVHWLHSERQCNGVCEFMCLGRLTVMVGSCCIVQIMNHLWPLTVSFTLIWSGELHDFAYMHNNGKSESKKVIYCR